MDTPLSSEPHDEEFTSGFTCFVDDHNRKPTLNRYLLCRLTWKMHRLPGWDDRSCFSVFLFPSALLSWYSQFMFCFVLGTSKFYPWLSIFFSSLLSISLVAVFFNNFLFVSFYFVLHYEHHYTYRFYLPFLSWFLQYITSTSICRRPPQPILKDKHGD